MSREQKALEEIVLTRILHLNATLYGMVTGIVAGLGLFVATNWLVLKGGEIVGPHLALLNQFFIGYQISFVGSLIGLGYAFVCGFVLGYVVARVYNSLASLWGDKQQPSTS